MKISNICNSLIPDAGTYLPSTALTLLIRAELTEEEVQKEIKRQKNLLKRLSVLLPHLLKYFRFEKKNDAFNFLRCLDDCHSDIKIASIAKRYDKQKREILESLSYAANSLADTTKALKAIERFVDNDFESIHQAYCNQFPKLESLNFDFSNFLENIKVFSDYLEIGNYKAKTEEDFLLISSNQVRTHLVEYAYMMSRFWGGPPLVTTPGSQLSAMCSLLYELVGGPADESLSGAINRYARSDERKNIDVEDLEILEELEVDNFCAAKSRIGSALESYEKYHRMLDAEKWTDGARLLITLKMQDDLSKIKLANDEYGPHLVLLNQLSQSDLEKSDERIKAISDNLKQLHIQIGKIRRQLRKMD